MISVETSTLLAQILPIAMLIVAFEGKAVKEIVMIYLPLWARMVLATVVALIVAGGVAAVFVCVYAAANNTPIEGGVVTIVFMGALAMGFLAAGYVAVGATSQYFVDGR